MPQRKQPRNRVTCPHCSAVLTDDEVKRLWAQRNSYRQTPHAGPGRPRKVKPEGSAAIPGTPAPLAPMVTNPPAINPEVLWEGTARWGNQRCPARIVRYPPSKAPLLEYDANPKRPDDWVRWAKKLVQPKPPAPPELLAQLDEYFE